MNEREIENKWNQIFERDYIKERIVNIADKFPEVSSLNLNFGELQAFDLIDPLAEYPEKVLDIGKKILAQFIEDATLQDTRKIDSVQISIRPTYGIVNPNIRDIRHWHNGQ